MTVKEIDNVKSKVTQILFQNLEMPEYAETIHLLKPVFDYAIDKAENDDLLKGLQKAWHGATGGSIIEETPKAHVSTAAEEQSA